MSISPTNMFSEQTGHKYTFQLELKKLFITPSLPFEVKIVWARGQNRIQSQNPIKLQPPQNQVTLQQCFCNKSTVLFNPKKFQFRKKQSRIQVILYANGSPKQGGQFVLNLCEILDPYNIRKQQQKVYKVVTRQQKPRCEIQFKLTAEYCQQMIRDEQREAGSVVGSISSKNTTSMNQGPSMISGLTTMNQAPSSISGLQGKQYVQKKNLFLYQAPSKDNQSVVSYNSYSTGMMRYNSGKKEREDSTKKEEYGLSTRREVPSTEMFAKTTSVNMKEFDTRSKGGYNRVTMQQNYDNRTQNYDPQTSKQLQDEQSRRSKLQAEVSRLNIYMKEQSNKLTQYIQENTRLKEQLNRLSSQHQSIKPILQKQTSAIKGQYQQQLNKMRQQKDDLHNRAFQLNNQNRQLTRRYERAIEQKQAASQQLRKIKSQKQRTQTRLQSLHKNLQTLAGHKQVSVKQQQNLKDQLQHMKSLNINLRQSLQKQRRKIDEIQYATSYQKSALQQSTKKKQVRLYELERENSVISVQLKDRQRQLQTKKELIYRLEKTSTQYKDKVIASESDKNRMLEENGGLRLQVDRVKRQLLMFKDSVSRVRDEKTAEYEQRNTQLQTINYQHQQKLNTLQYQLEQNLAKSRSLEYELQQNRKESQQNKKSNSQVQVMNEMMKKDLQDKKNQIYRLETSMRGFKDMQNKYYSLEKTLAQKQRQLIILKQQNGKNLYKINELQHKTSELEQQNRRLSNELQQSRKKSRNMPNVDVNQILRQTVHMQVELKFKTDELLRLKNIQQKHQQLLYQIQLQLKNKRQLQQQTQKLQKQLKQKNKLYLIQLQKSKIVHKQKSQLQKLSDQLKLQIKKCHEIIFNGDRQVKDMQGHIVFLETENLSVKEKNNRLENQVGAFRGKVVQMSRVQNVVKALQKQCDEKSQAASVLAMNLNNAHKKIQQLEHILYARQTQAQQAIRTAQSSSQKLIQLQSTQSSLSQQLNKSVHQKKSLQLKCETMMQQLHSLKKQFEQQKVRSTSVVSMRSSEDQVRIRQMQNQLDKKEKIISKLTKQKLEIQEENINLHVQVMKKLSQMEKNKEIAISTAQ